MKKTLWITLFSFLFLAGCSGKGELYKVLQSDTTYEKALVYTREAQIIRSFETKASVSATLLNELFPKKYPYEKGVVFFVGVISDLKAETFEKHFRISLNGTKPTSIVPVERHDTLYLQMPSVTRWGKYWVITFPSQSSKRLTIDFEIDPYGAVELTFQRPMPRR